MSNPLPTSPAEAEARHTPPRGGKGSTEMSIGRNTPLPNVPDAVTLQWANGKTMARPIGGPRFASFVGFHIEVGQDNRLDETLRAAGIIQIEIKHQRPGGAEIVHHWSLGDTIRILPITAGPVASTVAACLSNGNGKATADAGIGLRWGRGDGERSRMAVRVFVWDLWATGYRAPVQFATKSRMTDVLLAVLLDHTRAVVACDGLVDRTKHPEPVSPAELWLPLAAGEEVEFGRGDTATVVPFASDHPVELDAEYLRTAWRDKEVYAAACAVWPLVKAWATSYAHGNEVSPDL